MNEIVEAGLIALGVTTAIGLMFFGCLWLATLEPKPKQKGVAAKPKKSLEERRIDELREWKPVGSKLKYLGREMVVTGHSEVHAVGYYMYRAPLLSVDYADDHGVIHSCGFSYDEAKALMKATSKRRKGAA